MQRLCRFCQHSFEPSKFRPDQSVCSQPDCQRRRRTEYHRRKIATDPVYAQVVGESRKKWRDAHPDYQKTIANRMPPPSSATGSCSGGETPSVVCSFL